MKAIETDSIDSRRLSNYKKLLRENAQATATLAQKRQQGKDFAQMVKEVKRIKQSKHAE